MANASSLQYYYPSQYSSLKHLNNSSCNKQVIFNPNNKRSSQSQSMRMRASANSSMGMADLPIINVDYLKREFSSNSNGVSFQGVGDHGCVVKMRLENGSGASLMLPSGLITSYKPFMWHGGTVELLHTSVTEGAENEDEVVIQGGVSMDLNFIATDTGFSSSSSSNKWALLDVRGTSDKSIQVELISIGPRHMVEIKCLVTLQQDFLGSEIAITNPSSSSCLQLAGSIINHLTVSTPDATYAVGLQGSSYYRRRPMASDFSIIPPEYCKDENMLTYWGQKGFDGLLSSPSSRRGRKVIGQELWTDDDEEEGYEEDDDCAQMTEKTSRIYSDAPRELTIMDRGRRNSVVIRRSGFNELYIFSPGSDHEWYGKYAFICVGPSAMLKPIILGPQATWRGAQYLYNPNL